MKAKRISSRQPSSQALRVSRVVSSGDGCHRNGAPSAAARLIWSHRNSGDIASDEQQRGERPAAVAHPHPPLAEPARPAEPVPAGERDAADPARFLAHRGVEVGGEMAAAGDHGAAARARRDADEHSAFSPSAPRRRPSS